MGKYRKKPVVIEAVQLRWDTWSEMCEFAGVGEGPDQPHATFVTKDGKLSKDRTERRGLLIPTLEGTMLAIEGD